MGGKHRGRTPSRLRRRHPRPALVQISHCRSQRDYLTGRQISPGPQNRSQFIDQIIHRRSCAPTKNRLAAALMLLAAALPAAAHAEAKWVKPAETQAGPNLDPVDPLTRDMWAKTLADVTKAQIALGNEPQHRRRVAPPSPWPGDPRLCPDGQFRHPRRTPDRRNPAQPRLRRRRQRRHRRHRLRPLSRRHPPRRRPHSPPRLGLLRQRAPLRRRQLDLHRLRRRQARRLLHRLCGQSAHSGLPEHCSVCAR